MRVMPDLFRILLCGRQTGIYFALHLFLIDCSHIQMLNRIDCPAAIALAPKFSSFVHLTLQSGFDVSAELVYSPGPQKRARATIWKSAKPESLTGNLSIGLNLELIGQ
jgi:hypothetical protein